MTTLHAAIIAAGIALAGLLVAFAIVVTEPADLEPVQPEPRFHTVWMPKFFQLVKVMELGIVPSCDALNDSLVASYESFQNQDSTALGQFSEDEWASLECHE